MIRELTERLATEEDVRLSSAEVFIEESSIAMENSRGARGRRVQTELLLDVVLPGKDGWWVMEEKEKDGTIREIPVVLVSAQDPREQPLGSKVLSATMGQGLSLGQLVRCSLELPGLLSKAD